MGFWIVALNPIRIRMARCARWIGALRIMARGTTFNIAAGKTGVFTAAASDAERDKTRFLVRCGLKSYLIDIAARFVTGSAECLLAMACLAICCFACGCNSVCEAEIQVVYFCKFLALTAVVSC